LATELASDAVESNEATADIENRARIEEIIGVETMELIQMVKLSDADARTLHALNERQPRSLNAQARVTVKDLRACMRFCVR
jgi:hypothetical protein